MYKYKKQKDYKNASKWYAVTAMLRKSHAEIFYKEMDKNPAHFKDGKIIVHPSVEKVMRAAGENGSIGATFDYNDGGMQLPHLIHQALSLIHI